MRRGLHGERAATVVSSAYGTDVPLTDITWNAVLAAIREFDVLGRDAFLEKYGFRPAKRYLVSHEGRLYDSKAVAGVAHGFLPGRSPLKPSEFSGGVGAGQAARVLRDLGFEVPG